MKREKEYEVDCCLCIYLTERKSLEKVYLQLFSNIETNSNLMFDFTFTTTMCCRWYSTMHSLYGHGHVQFKAFQPEQ